MGVQQNISLPNSKERAIVQNVSQVALIELQFPLARTVGYFLAANVEGSSFENYLCP